MSAESDIIPKWPNLFDPHRGENVPPDLIGATILAIGTLDGPRKDRPEGGGLVIDYRPKNATKRRRVTLAFTELGMRVHHPIQGGG